MTLQEEIQSIITDSSLTVDEKRARLLQLVTPQEVLVLLSEPIKVVKLKEPLCPKTNNMHILRLSVYNSIFESILSGEKDVERRDFNDYYMDRCTYVENGVRYLVPFDAIAFYVGRGNRARKATVKINDIMCDGDYLYFHLGEVLNINN